MRYFIDGYNVIHASGRLKAIADTNIESARDAVIEIAALLLKPGVQVLVVFDGQGATTDIVPALSGIDNLLAVYTAKNLSADTWIERTVYKANRRNLCTIITADGGIRDLCRGLGARVFTPEWLEGETGKNQAHNRLPGAAPTSRELGDRIDTESFDRLAELRKKLGDQDESDRKR